MVKLLGAALVAGGCAWLGFRRALELKDRVRALEQMAGGLALVERELALGAPPLPRLLEGAAGRCDGPAAELFSGCAQALARSQAYQRLHLEEMPDRGCQGTLVSYWATIPVYMDHVRQYFAEGERECPHQPLTLDAPPPPDTAFFS